MKMMGAALGLMLMAVPAHAENVAAMISKFRMAHGQPAVRTSSELTRIAERQAHAMAAGGIMDHSVAGSFNSRIAAVHSALAAENIAAGTRSWTETLSLWESSPGHTANLLLPGATSIGVAVARSGGKQGKAFWAMEIAVKAAARERPHGRPGVSLRLR